MSDAETRRIAQNLRQRFEQAGAVPFDTSLLLPAETLLDLYGEDIRARAYVTSDAVRGEQMLRPDFTVPLVLSHLASAAEAGAYTYAGEVFRRQDIHPDRPNEYLQVGFEVFGGGASEAADARVFSVIFDALRGHDLRMAIGDIGLLTAAVKGLETTERRKRALLRHIWRPARFRALIERFSGRVAPPPSRAHLLAEADPLSRAVPLIGLRSREEIAERIEALRGDAQTAPLRAVEVDALERLLEIACPADQALLDLRKIASDMPSIAPALDRLSARLDAIANAGIEVASLDFEASYGRTQMEYYDGFVFGFYDPAHPDLPPIASGGRYDALTRHLGQGRVTPAVGGVIRPDRLARLASAGIGKQAGQP